MASSERPLRRAGAVCLLLVVHVGVSASSGLGAQHATSAEAEPKASVAAGTPASDQAIARWTQQVARVADDQNAWRHLGEAFMQKARETADASYYRRAEAAFQKALSSQPEDVGALTGMAWVYGALHEFEQSTAWAQKALALDPRHAAAYGMLGDAAVETGDYDAAFDHYQKMLDLRPDLGSYSRGAQLLFLTGDHRKAVWLMHKAIAAGAPYAENIAWARAQLALMHWSTGAFLPAEQLLDAALRAAPGNHHLLAALGKVKAARKEYPAAIEHYRRAIAIAPHHDTVAALGDLYLATGQRDEAEKQYALVEVIYKLSKAAGVRGDLQMARFYADHDRHLEVALEEAITAYRIRRGVYAADTLAWCYYKNGRYEEARKAIVKALSRRTPDAQILFHAGMIYAKLGDRPTAQTYLYQALSLNPAFHPIQARIAAETLQQLAGVRRPDASNAPLP